MSFAVTKSNTVK